MFVRLHFPYICGYRTKRQKNTFLYFFSQQVYSNFFHFSVVFVRLNWNFICLLVIAHVTKRIHFLCPTRCEKAQCAKCQHSVNSQKSLPALAQQQWTSSFVWSNFFLRDPAHHRLGQHRRHFLARSAVSRLLLESAVLWSIEAEPKFWICWKILIILYLKFWFCWNILIILN